MTGIYGIQNIQNGKWYVGQSVSIGSRWKQHQKMLGEHHHHSLKLQMDYQDFGPSSFSFRVLEECDRDYLNCKEQEYIRKYDSVRNGYNIIGDANFVVERRIERKENQKQEADFRSRRTDFIYDVQNRLAYKFNTPLRVVRDNIEPFVESYMVQNTWEYNPMNYSLMCTSEGEIRHHNEVKHPYGAYRNYTTKYSRWLYVDDIAIISGIFDKGNTQSRDPLRYAAAEIADRVFRKSKARRGLGEASENEVYMKLKKIKRYNSIDFKKDCICAACEGSLKIIFSCDEASKKYHIPYGENGPRRCVHPIITDILEKYNICKTPTVKQEKDAYYEYVRLKKLDMGI